MIVRCGACRSQFDVPGPGRYSCPACGSVNMVRAANGPGGQPPPQGPGPYGGGQPGMGDPSGLQTPPPPPEPEAPSPKITCPECDYEFIVGDIAVAICPMCSAEVETGRGSPAGDA